MAGPGGRRATGQAPKWQGQLGHSLTPLTNNGSKNFDPALLTTDATYGADGTPADKVFDSATLETTGGFSTLVRPGRTVSDTELIGSPKGEILTLQVSPDFNSEVAIFEGKAN